MLAALTPANRLVCRVCVATGLRVGDVVALRTDQLKAQFWITEQKTGKRRRVNLTKQLLGELLDQAGDVWVFPGSRLRRSRGNVAKVQRALNHSDAATTMVYAMAYQLYEAKYGQQHRGAASK